MWPFKKRGPEKVDLDRVRNLTAMTVATKGQGYVYPFGEPGYSSGLDADMCVYFTRDDNRAPACIVGYVLDHLGVADEDLQGMTFSAVSLNDHQDKVKFSADALMYLGVLQEYQDSGSTWLKAYIKAEDNAGYIGQDDE